MYTKRRGTALSQREMENEGPDVVNNLCEDDESSSDEYQDAQESPLEQCITDSMVKSKDSNSISSNVSSLFSLIPSGVATYKSPQPCIVEEAEPVINPDSFSDFFELLSPSKSKSPRNRLPFPRLPLSTSTKTLTVAAPQLQFVSAPCSTYLGPTTTTASTTLNLNNPLQVGKAAMGGGLAQGINFTQQQLTLAVNSGPQLGLFQNTSSAANSLPSASVTALAQGGTIFSGTNSTANAPSIFTSGEFTFTLPVNTQQQQQQVQQSNSPFQITKPSLSAANSSITTNSTFSGQQMPATSQPQTSSTGTSGLVFPVQPPHQQQQQQPSQMSNFGGAQVQSSQNSGGGGGITFNFSQPPANNGSGLATSSSAGLNFIAGTQPPQATGGNGLKSSTFTGQSNSAQQQIASGSSGLNFNAGTNSLQSSGGLSLFKTSGSAQKPQQNQPSIFTARGVGAANTQQPNQSSSIGGLFSNQQQSTAAGFPGFKFSAGAGNSSQPQQGIQLATNSLSGGNTGGLTFGAGQGRGRVSSSFPSFNSGSQTSGSSSGFNFLAGTASIRGGGPFQNAGSAPGQTSNPLAATGNQTQKNGINFNFSASAMGALQQTQQQQQQSQMQGQSQGGLQQQQQVQQSFQTAKPSLSAANSVTMNSIFSLNSGQQMPATSQPQMSLTGTSGLVFPVQPPHQQQQPSQMSNFGGAQVQSSQNSGGGGGITFNFSQPPANNGSGLATSSSAGLNFTAGTQPPQATGGNGLKSSMFNFSAGLSNSAQQQIASGSSGLNFNAGTNSLQSSGGLSLFNTSGSAQKPQQNQPLIFTAGGVGAANTQQPNQSSSTGGLFSNQQQSTAAGFPGFKFSAGAGNSSQPQQGIQFATNSLSGGNTGGLTFSALQGRGRVSSGFPSFNSGSQTSGSSSRFNFSAGTASIVGGGLFQNAGSTPDQTSNPLAATGNQTQKNGINFNFSASVMGAPQQTQQQQQQQQQSQMQWQSQGGLFSFRQKSNSSTSGFNFTTNGSTGPPQPQKQPSFATPAKQPTMPGQGGFNFQTTPSAFSFSAGTPGPGDSGRPVARARRRKK